MTTAGSRFLASLFFTSVACATLAAPRLASAQDAADIKKQGDEAMDSGRPADALAAYTKAYEQTHDPALLYNKGRALMALTDYPQALKELEAFDAAAPPELKSRVPGLAKMIADLRSRVTTIAIACDVVGARVRLRDRTLGTCPLPATVTVVSGHGMLEVTSEGYVPWTRDVDLPGGGVASFTVHLASRTTTGVLVVRSDVAGAHVTVDGKTLGDVPVEASLGGGTHAIDVQRDGYKTTHTSAVVNAGERREIDVALEQESTLFGKWWFWTAVGVAVAGGVTVAIIAATSERSPDKGTVAPGVVQGGLRGAGFRF
ncbi:MAG TPA: PEGA domain-containing protein [Labilithrix sp.]